MSGQESFVTTIAALLSDGWSKAAIRRSMRLFKCERNTDVEEFAHRRALSNELNGSTRTYLVLDGSAYEEDELVIMAFVSVALTATDYSGIAPEARREILGNVPGIWVNNSFPGYLIAELARDDEYDNEDVPGDMLMMHAESCIREAMELVGGGLVYLDCKGELVGYYNDFGYEEIYLDDRTGLHKMMKRLEA